LLDLRRPPRSLLIAYGLVGAFMLLEGLLRQGEAARSSRAATEDQGTTRLLGGAYGAGVLLMPVLAAVRGKRNVPAPVGPALMIAAIGLRSWAAWTLGAFYTRTLRTVAGQQVVRRGPYRIVRHPGYLGTLLMWLGFGLSTGDWLIGIGWAGLMFVLYRRRIAAEETMLERELGEAYRAYSVTTPQLIPGWRG
jgi:protein-S-isoprenylcysteine O-methyltransferase